MTNIVVIRELSSELQNFLGSLTIATCDRSDISFLRHSIESISVFVQKVFSITEEKILRTSFYQFYNAAQNLLNQMKADCFRCENFHGYEPYSEKSMSLIKSASESLSTFCWNLTAFESGERNYRDVGKMTTMTIVTKSFPQKAAFCGCLPCHSLEDWNLEKNDSNPTFFGNTNLQYVFACEKILGDKNGFELMKILGKNEDDWNNRKSVPIFESEQDVVKAAQYFGCSLNSLVDLAEVFHHPYPNRFHPPIIQDCSYFQIIRAVEELLYDRCVPLNNFLSSIGRKEWEWKNRHEPNCFFVKTKSQVLDIAKFFGIEPRVFFAYAARFKDLEAWDQFRDQQPILYQPNGTNEIFTSGFEEFSEYAERFVGAAGKHMIDWYDRWKIDRPFFETTDQLFAATRFLIDEVKKRGGDILDNPKLLLTQWMNFGKTGNGLPPLVPQMPPELTESHEN